MVRRQMSAAKEAAAAATKVKIASGPPNVAAAASSSSKTDTEAEAMRRTMEDFDWRKLKEVDEAMMPGEYISAATEPEPATFEEYLALHEKMLSMSSTYFDANKYIELAENEVYYLVSERWVEELFDWQSQFEDKFEDLIREKEPVPEDWTPGNFPFMRGVDNTDLVMRYSRYCVDLVDDIQEHTNFFLVDENAWGTLMSHFGGGPEIGRLSYPAKNGQALLDIHGIPVKVVISNDLKTYRHYNVGRFDTVKQVLVSLCRIYGVNVRKARLWDFYAGQCHACLDVPDATMRDCDITPNQFLFVELAAENGTFLLDSEEPPIRSALPASTVVGLGSRSYGAAYGRGIPAEPGLVGLFNLRNTCYMNSTLQCLSNIPQLREFFTSDAYLEELNEDNVLGTGGRLAHAFADLVKSLWEQSPRLPRAISPGDFKQILDDVHPDFAGFMQHDAQELLSYLLDDMHEDVNRVRKKPYTEPVEANGRPDVEVAREEVARYKQRNDSHVSDLCAGMLISKVACPREGCSHVSVTFDPFFSLSLPVEAGPAKSRIIEVTFVPFESPLERSVFRVEAPVTGPVALLRNLVASHAGVPADTLLLVELADHKIIRTIAESIKLESIQPSATIYAYENPDASKHLDMTHGDFTRWYRPPMSLTDDEMVVEENYLSYLPAAAVTGTSAGAAAAAAARQRNAGGKTGTAAGAGPLPSALKHTRGPPPPPPLPDPVAMLEGIDHIKVDVRGEGQDEQSAITIQTRGPDVSTLSGRKALAKGKFACPFQKRQMWLGHIEPYSFASSRLAMRMEVVHVELMDNNESFRVYMLLDINRIIPRSKNQLEQETRLLVGEYVPAEMVGGRRGRRGRRGGARKASKVDAGSEGKDEAKTENRKSLARFSPRNVSKALFAGLVRRNSKQRGDPSLEDEHTGEGKFDSETELHAVDEEGEDLADDGSDAAESSGDSSSDDKKEDHLLNNMGEVYLDSGPWKAYYYSTTDPSYVKRTADFKVRASVDEHGRIFFGKVVFDGGYQTTETMAFYLSLAPPEMIPLMDLSLPQSQQPLIDRKITLNNTRSIRAVNKVNTKELDPRHPYARTDWCLDPGIFVVDRDITDSQVYWMVVDYYVDLYNKFMQESLPGLEGAPDLLQSLPDSISRDDVASALEVYHAGRNYVFTPTQREPKSGSMIHPDSDDLFFSVNKNTFLRIVNFWSANSPVIDLFATMDLYLEDRFERGHLRAEENMRISDCMDLLCNEEKLSEHDSWYCSNCKVHTEAVKSMRIWSFPPVLILHLKRFAQEADGYFSEKLMTQVDFPLEDLDLRRYALDPESKGSSVYDLCCITNHYGGIGSGHYTCYARHETKGSWHEFDDDAVLPVANLSALASSAAYVLFYLRRDLRPEAWGEVFSSAEGLPDPDV
ncbi:Ubiquitin carboxyl-terminal hydrolase, putative [Hondaea fermentalgiana]|uniref:Ubiquitin carboxyl-terminal hydrolase, putative n=1 Tax=Hondaea fermentalgiana TaxID=2315210 RepID=A0A2R5GMH6_9STRA|nr:Ubiquitin carboxyl-terminal hydrolase, putative [Hondaea fermentalgiana]|eukprot:GBG32102.1 Ubiquitin carboxyl-terminal hydrolase, putative [Hondaea fermentalgiana]